MGVNFPVAPRLRACGQGHLIFSSTRTSCCNSPAVVNDALAGAVLAVPLRVGNGRVQTPVPDAGPVHFRASSFIRIQIDYFARLQRQQIEHEDVALIFQMFTKVEKVPRGPRDLSVALPSDVVKQKNTKIYIKSKRLLRTFIVYSSKQNVSIGYTPLKVFSTATAKFTSGAFFSGRPNSTYRGESTF